MIKNGDFIEINYTGKVDGKLYDTTLPDVAKKAGIPSENLKPIRICVGKGGVLPGLDESLVGKNEGDKYTVVLEPAKAFGVKSAKEIQSVSLSKFTKDKINPQPGMRVNIDGKLVTIKRVGGGRVLVDFNHPLAGQSVTYDMIIERIVTNVKEKLEMYIPMKFEYNDADKSVEIEKFPLEFQSKMEKQIKENVPEVSKVNFKGE